MELFSLPRKIKILKRYKTIINEAIAYGFGYMIEHLDLEYYLNLGKNFIFRKQKEREVIEKEPNEVRFRKLLETLGPTFIKLGQMLSTRVDLFSEPYLEELKKLQDSVKPVDFSRIRQILEEEIGNLDRIFSTISEDPVASGSIAQVHCATLKDGTEVVIKVQKPEISELCQVDMEILYHIARLLQERIENASLYQPVKVIDEFHEAMARELDFNHEAICTMKMNAMFEDDPLIVIPEIFNEYTTSRVLTMKKLSGSKITDLEFLEQNDIDTAKTARKLMEIFLYQILVEGFFHGDPHPGNILMTSDGKINLIDFGLTGKLNIELLENLAALFMEISSRNSEHIVRRFIKMGVLVEEVDTPKLKMDISYFIDTVFDTPIGSISIGKLLNRLITVAAKHKLRTPPEISLIVKVLIQIEGIVAILNPELKTLEIAKPYASIIIRRVYNPARYYRILKYFLEDSAEMLLKLPKRIDSIASKIEKGKLGIEFYHKSLEGFSSTIDKASNRIAVSLIVGALILASSFIMLSGKGAMLFGFSVFGIVGFSIAGILGLWLVLSILSSGRM